MGNKPHVVNNSGNNEWYTPAPIIEAARDVMGGIDLDPASCELANQTVKATKYYSIETNGLSHEWHGRVWLNPPYIRELCSVFIQKLIREFYLRRVTNACLLTNNASDTQWWKYAVYGAQVVCFLEKRVKFYKPEGNTGSPLQGQTVMFFSFQKDDCNRFASVFGKLGTVLEHYR